MEAELGLSKVGAESVSGLPERVTLVLGGGGMKGLAHVGAWRAVLECGITVTSVVGSSIGGLVGAMIAAGVAADDLAVKARALAKSDIVVLNRWALLFNGIRQTSVFRDDTFREYIASVLPVATFDELGLPLSVNAVDLDTGRLEWFGALGRMDVSLADAIYASCALPVFYPPARIGDRHYVDGGVLDALPVVSALEAGADRVIAIDVGAGPAGSAAVAVDKGMIAIHQRVMQIMGYSRRRAREEARRESNAYPDTPVTYIRPNLDGYDTFDFNSTEYFLDEGYRAAMESLRGSEGISCPAS